MSRFRKVVSFLVAEYGLHEDVAAGVVLDLLRQRVFDWRRL